jgi:hypothetical protein
MVGILDRVGMVITTPGQGTVTANTLISNRFNTPAEAGAVSAQQYYWIHEEDLDYEIFIGTWTLSGTTVSRDTVLQSKIAGVHGTTKMTLAGNATLRSVAPAEFYALLFTAAGGTFTGPVYLSADPSVALEAATKQYVDTKANNLSKKFASVRAASTANVTISTALVGGQVLDGVTLVTGDTILVKDQSAPAQNGVYDVAATPVRNALFDTWTEIPGSLVSVQEGTANAETTWLSTADNGGTLGTTAITWVATPPLNSATLASVVHAATSKTTPVDADELPLADSAASFGLKKLTWANLKATLKATAAYIWAGTNDVTYMTPKNAADSSAFVTLTSSTSIATDASTGYNFFITLAHNTTLANPTNLIDGRTYQYLIQQDGTGNRTGAFGTTFEFTATPTLSTVAGKRDLIVATYHAASGKLISSFRKGS